ncbi:MAG: BatA domain-containing protein [Deferribacteres bacterium]|nr:BatA domain-containing protein [Deferribacteres bacterium]
MPSFLNSAFLMIGAAAVAVPILIHLLMRNKVVRIDFAAMRFLMESQKQVVRWLKLKQLLILLLRIAAIALLALAFARPYFPESSALGLWASDEKEVGLIVDISASMLAAEHLTQAKSALRDVFDGLAPETIVSVYFAGGHSRMIVEREPLNDGIEARVLSMLQPTYQHCNLREATQTMDDLLRGSALFKRELYIISDFQRSGWPETGSFLQLASHAEVKLLPVTEKPWRNITIIDAQVPDETEQPWLCTVQNQALDVVKSAEVNLVVAGKAIATQKVEFTDGSTQVVPFEQVKLPRGDIAGYFEVNVDDDFVEDNRYYFVAQQREYIRVLAVNGEKASGPADELFFADKAVNTHGSAFRLIQTEAARLDRISPDAFDVVLLANVTGLNNNDVQILRTFVRNGGGLLIAPGDKVDIKFYNRFLEEIAPASLQNLAKPLLDRNSGDIMMLSNIGHPAFDQLSNALSNDISAARFFQHWILQPKVGSQMLANFGDDAPAIVVGTAGRGKVVMLSFPIDGEWSDLPIQTSYLPLLHTLLSYAQPPAEKVQFVRVGQPLYLGDSFQPNTQVEVATPDNVVSTWRSDNLIYGGASLPGIYRFQQKSMHKNIAVNLTTEESDTDIFVPEAFLAKLYSADEQTVIDQSQARISLPEQQAESEQKVWRYLVFVAFAFLIGESFLGNRTPR